jgi:hypothetical protein
VATLRLGSRVVIGAQNKETCSGCSVSLTTCTKSSPSLAENAARDNFAGSRLDNVRYNYLRLTMLLLLEPPSPAQTALRRLW